MITSGAAAILSNKDVGLTSAPADKICAPRRKKSLTPPLARPTFLSEPNTEAASLLWGLATIPQAQGAQAMATYTLVCDSEGREISWTTAHAATAHKWYAFTCEHARAIDTGAPVFSVALWKDGKVIKSAELGS